MAVTVRVCVVLRTAVTPVLPALLGTALLGTALLGTALLDPVHRRPTARQANRPVAAGLTRAALVAVAGELRHDRGASEGGGVVPEGS